MIVVDTNILAYLWISGLRSRDAELALDKDSLWIAPFLWRSEFRNVLTQHVRKKLLSLESAVDTMQKAERQMNKNEFHLPSEKILELVITSKCSAYDCEYMALAQQFVVKVVTADKIILSEFPRVAISLENFIEE